MAMHLNENDKESLSSNAQIIDESEHTNKKLFPQGRLLVCPSHFFDVKYEINPWMKVANAPEKQSANRQWQNLHHTLIRLGAYLEYIEPVDAYPDIVFTANAGLIKGNDLVLSNFRYPERQGEELITRAWFEKNGFKVHALKSGYFEGEGDALFSGEKLFLGHGFRTDLKIADELSRTLNVKQIIPCELIDGRFYHLDTCFAPLGNNLAMVHRSAIAPESFKRIEQEIDLLVVPDAESVNFVCNAVVLGKNVILPAGCPQTYKMLEAKGYQAHPVKLSEFLKGGGSAKCLTLYFEHNL